MLLLLVVLKEKWSAASQHKKPALDILPKTRPGTVLGRARAHASVTGQVVERIARARRVMGEERWGSGAECIDSKDSEHVLPFGWTKPTSGLRCNWPSPVTWLRSGNPSHNLDSLDQISFAVSPVLRSNYIFIGSPKAALYLLFFVPPNEKTMLGAYSIITPSSWRLSGNLVLWGTGIHGIKSQLFAHLHCDIIRILAHDSNTQKPVVAQNTSRCKYAN